MQDTLPADARTILARQQMLAQQHNKRLARKIHDDISQKMTLLSLQLSLAASPGGEPEDWSKSCKGWADLVMELGQTIREITSELQPRISDEFGLPSALRWFAQTSSKTGCCTYSDKGGKIALAPFAANELFGICREIVSDFLLPAGVARVEIELEQKAGAVLLHLRATGKEPGSEAITEKALEAIALRERLLCLEGAVELKNSSETGSVLTLSVPAGRPLVAA